MTPLSNLQNARLLTWHHTLYTADLRLCFSMPAFAPSSTWPFLPSRPWAFTGLLFPAENFLSLNQSAPEPQKDFSLSSFPTTCCSFLFLKQRNYLFLFLNPYLNLLPYFIPFTEPAFGNVYLHCWDIVNFKSYYEIFKSMVYVGDCEFGLATNHFLMCLVFENKEQAS